MNETNHLSLLNALHVLLQYSPAAGSAEGLDDIVECVAGRLGAEVAILPAAGSSADSKSTAEAQLVCVAPACHGCADRKSTRLNSSH